VGVLDCQSNHVDHFDNETVNLLTLFSTQASIAIQNARLYTLERQRARQLEAINTIAQQSTAVMDLGELLARSASVIQQAFQVPHVSLLLREEANWFCGRMKERSRLVFPKADVSPPIASPGRAYAGSTSGTVIEKDLRAMPECERLFGNPPFAHQHPFDFFWPDPRECSR
jgi:hypothetical protein